LALAAIGVLLGVPIAFASLLGVSPAMALAVTFLERDVQIPLVLVWLAGGCLLYRRWSFDRGVSHLALLAVGGMLATAVLRGLLMIGLYSGKAGAGKLALLYGAAIIPPLLQAGCWVLVMVALLKQGHPPPAPSAAQPSSHPSRPAPSVLGPLIFCTLLGAGVGFCLDVASDTIIASPYRLLIHVLGGCLFGFMIALALEFAARSRRR